MILLEGFYEPDKYGYDAGIFEETDPVFQYSADAFEFAAGSVQHVGYCGDRAVCGGDVSGGGWFYDDVDLDVSGFLIGLSGGINVLTALYIGARNRKSVSETVHSAFLVSLVVGLILLILGVSTSRGVLVLLNTKEELIDKAALYIRIYFLGIPALALYNFGNAVFSAAGGYGGVR